MKFLNFNFKQYIIKTLNDQNIKYPTLVQQKIIPLILKSNNSNNVIVQSKTGSGKTLAFLLPILQQVKINLKETQALIITPTRELSMQIFKEINKFKLNNPSLKVFNLVGGSSIKTDYLKFKNKSPHLVIGTINRILKLYESNFLKVLNLKNIIIDEIDMIYEFGFIKSINDFFIKIKKKQNNFNVFSFSATIPQIVEMFFKKQFKNLKIIKLSKNNKNINSNIKHYLIPTKLNKINDLILLLLKTINPYICMIFLNKKSEVNKIYDLINSNNYNVAKIHGGMNLRERKQIIKKIYNNNYKYIICSDIMARGLDIDGVSHVISLNLPKDLKYYIHRSGRTGRYKYNGYSYIIWNYNNLAKIDKISKKYGINFIELNYNNNILEPKKNNKTIKINNLKTFNYKREILKSKYKKKKPNYKKKQKFSIKHINK